MSYHFKVWKPACHIGRPDEIKAACERVQQELGAPSATSASDVVFEIIDVRPGRHSEQTVFDLSEKLTKLMLADDEQVTLLSSNSQLLFVGATPSLSSHPEEEGTAEDPVSRDIRRDVEFAIRVLRSYGLALYGCVDDGDLTNKPPSELPLVLSALRLFQRFYRELTPSEKSKEVARPTIRPPSKLNAGAALARLKKDYCKLRDTAQEMDEFSRLGEHDLPENRPFQELDLLREIGLLFELGRGERPEGMSPRRRLETLAKDKRLTFGEDEIAHSSYSLFINTLAKVSEWVPEYRLSKGLIGDDGRPFPNGSAEDPRGEPAVEKRQEFERSITLDMYKLERFNLLRDFGRVLGQGALPRLRGLDRETRSVLIIDDWLFETLRDGDADNPRLILVDRLNCALKAAWPGGATVHVTSSTSIEAAEAHSANHFVNVFSAQSQAFHLPAKRKAIVGATLLPRLEDYSLILIDPEATGDSLGAARVQRIAKYLEQVSSPPALLAGEPRRPRATVPPLIAFSQKESSGYVQQCLNMGARAFVAKHRPYHLLFDLARVLNEPSSFRDDTQDASQFRLLRILKPNAAAKLKRIAVPFYIHGGFERADGTIEQHLLEHNWVRDLPKADLHCHFGTAIDLTTVTLLALNTAGYFLQSAPRATNHGSLHPNASELLDRIAQAVRLAAELRKKNDATPMIELLAAAAYGIRPTAKLEWSAFALGDAVISHLSEPNERCDHAHATALLVAAIQEEGGLVHASATGKSKRLAVGLNSSCDDIGSYLDELDGLMKLVRPAAGSPVAFSARGALALEAVRAHRHYQRLGFRWAGEPSRASMNDLVSEPAERFWSKLKRDFEGRIALAARTIREARGRAIPDDPKREDWVEARKRADKWLDNNRPKLGSLEQPAKETPALEAYVTVAREKRRRSLQLYLRGADLLGSAHLQYPENLLIATHAITRENASDNVIYSEIRCETTGYAKAGMGAHDATEILRHGFNLASMYWAAQPLRHGPLNDIGQVQASDSDREGRCYPLVRTNVLLAAKRHKKVHEARAVVELLDHYLERRPSDADRGWSRHEYHSAFGASIPAWWRPCDVVGFDISGNEAVGADWLEELIRQLASRSSPITIHAGEAASAQSIWDAVYKFNAIRIGHGLRLGEDLALLGHCVREGICMEMCPNSNFLTNAFEAPADVESEAAVMLDEGKYSYPLLRYMRAGMEVTLGTDNRHLHAIDGRTLTSEYLMAARLVGGLTRWEVLQIVKAGFKNAFLDKFEVRKLIGAAEEAIYRIIAADSA